MAHRTAFSTSALLPSTWLSSSLFSAPSIDVQHRSHAHPAVISSASSSTSAAASKAKTATLTKKKVVARPQTNTDTTRPIQSSTLDHIVKNWTPVIDNHPNKRTVSPSVTKKRATSTLVTSPPTPLPTTVVKTSTPAPTQIASTSAPPTPRRPTTTTTTTTTSTKHARKSPVKSSASVLDAPAPATSVSPVPSRSTPRKRRQKKIGTSRATSTTSTASTTSSTTVTPVPSVTQEETNFLNEQLEKHKREKEAKQARQSARETRSKKRTVSKNRSKSEMAPSSSAAVTSSAKVRTSIEITTTAKSTTRKRGRVGRTKDTQANSSVQDSFRAYMSEISKNNLLGQAEVISLARKIREGMIIERVQRDMEKTEGRRPTVKQISQKLGLPFDEIQRRRMMGTAAKNVLVSANLRLVSSVANKLAKSKNNNSMFGLTVDDMIQEGSVGLIRAAEKFDASRGYKFSTYATWWIRAYVMRSITNQGRCIKVPASVIDEYARIRRTFTELRESGIDKPTDDQVAQRLGITPGKLRMVVNVVTQVPTSLDTPINISGSSSAEGGSKSLSDVVHGDDHVEEKMVTEMQHRELDNAMRKYLRPVERAVVRLRFGLEDGQPRSFREVGEMLGLSKERIRQIVFRALPKLKTPEIQRMLQQVTMG